jgi:hypothetical protein
MIGVGTVRADVLRLPGLYRIAALTVCVCISAASVLYPHGAVGQEPVKPVQILVLDTGQALLPVSLEVMHGINSVIKAELSDRAHIFNEFLDADRFDGPQNQANMVRFLQEKYASTHLDVAVALAPAALRLLVDNRASLFPDTDVFAKSARATFAIDAASRHDRDHQPFRSRDTVDLALAVQPDATSLVVITGPPP